MNGRRMFARVLLAIYPALWRREYGTELLDILVARPLSARVVLNVAWSGTWQRVRVVQPSTVLGLVALAAVVAGVVMSPTMYGHTWVAMVRPTSKTWPTIEVTFLASEDYVLLMIIGGAWTYLRYGGPIRRSALAAVRMSLIAGFPVMLIGLLLLSGTVALTFSEPSSALRAFVPGPSPIALLTAPIFRLPESAIWGAVGGAIARWIRRRRTGSYATPS